jgi:hypothetical protein
LTFHSHFPPVLVPHLISFPKTTSPDSAKPSSGLRWGGGG